MKRGDIVTVVVQGDYGKPRPAVIVQADWFDETDTILVCLVTSHLRDAPAYRLAIRPTAETGLRVESQLQVDKLTFVRRSRIGETIGHLGDDFVAELDRRLAFVIGLGG